MTYWAALITALATCCFASFSWAVGAHFHRDRRLPLGMRLISIASLLGFGWMAMLLVAQPLARLWPLSAAMLLAALALFWWTITTTRRLRPAVAFAGEVPACVYARGPYKYVRHPFYSSYILFWLAISLASPGAAHWFVPAVMTVVYVVAARGEEQDFARSALAQAYDEYRQRTSMLVPLPTWPAQNGWVWRRGVSGRV